MGRDDKKATRRAAQQAAEARQRKEELRRRRKGRIAGLIAILAGLAVIVVFVVGTQGNNNDDEGSEAARDGGQRIAGANGECDFDVEPPENQAQQYDQPASQEQVLTPPGIDYWATIETSCGSIEVDLLEEEAPSTVANFIFLAEEGYYDGLTWHRIIDEFVIQGGDPEGDGSGGPGYEFDDELPEQSNVYTFGALAMANSGPNTNGSQFFFVTHDADAALEGERDLQPAGLQPLYSYFGRASEESYGTIDALQKVETSTEQATQDRPVDPVYILSVEIQER